MIVRAIGLPGVVTSPSATSNKRSNSTRQGLRTSSALRISAVSFAVSDGSRRFTGSVSVATRRKIAFFVHGSWHLVCTQFVYVGNQFPQPALKRMGHKSTSAVADNLEVK